MLGISVGTGLNLGLALSILAILFLFFLSNNIPVIDIILLVATSLEEILENLSEVGVIRFLIEAEISAIGEVGSELTREPLAENIDTS